MMVRAAQRMHDRIGLGLFDPDAVLDVISASRCLTDGKSVLVGREVPVSSSSAPAVNLAVFWDTHGCAWEMLRKHEEASDLPSGVFVPARHNKRERLMAALQRRGYAPHETLMVKHG